MTRLRRSGLLLPYVLLLLALLVAVQAPGTRAAAADPCRKDQLGGAKVTASAEFDHRGRDDSLLTSVMEIRVPQSWGLAPDLLLDSRSPQYRAALRCLLGKVTDTDEEGFFDSEWRLKPLTVKADGKWTTVHYEAVAWVSTLTTYPVGPWQLKAGANEWSLELTAPPNLAQAAWEDVHVRLGGPGAMSVTPAPAFGEKGTELKWRERNGVDTFRVVFRPPAAQQWSAIAATEGDFWEIFGYDSASGAFWFLEASGLLLLCARRLRRGLGGVLMPEEERALKTLKTWALLQALLALAVFLGDNAYRFMRQQLSWEWDYEGNVWLLALLLAGLALCFLGRVGKPFLIGACTFTVCLAAAYVYVERSESSLLTSSDAQLRPPGSWIVPLVLLAVLFVCILGLLSSGQRFLLMCDGGLPRWVLASASLAAAAATILWSYVAFDRSWERVSWLADPGWKSYGGQWVTYYDTWWWWFPYFSLNSLLAGASYLTPLALVGVLRVFRSEQREEDSFTPDQAEKFLLVVLFTLAVVPSYALYYGFSGDIVILIITLAATWGLLALGQARSVLEQPSADNAPLGKTVSRTDRSDLLRLARRFRQLQSRLQRAGAGSSGERTPTQESIEHEIDELDRRLPEGVRPVDLPFACGPMPTWWGNACRGALVACFAGLPATALMYWTDMIRNEAWVLTTESRVGTLDIVLEALFWQSTWAAGGFFLGALWRDLPGRHGPTKAFGVAVAFAVPVAAHQFIAQAIGQSVAASTPAMAAFASVMTFTGLVMDVQTFQSERRYWPTSAGLVAYVYQMRFASVAFCLAQLLALATIWKTLREGGPMAPPPSR
ncbi:MULTISPECIES: DUF6185 family protein [Streptomyces]|uniref:DUF6185 family protein n=1 Tax=Streptomyces TaxID=1883 RepID=UPI000F792EF5|nr:MULTISPECIES: DUF6185 family protein [Streptomyces]RST00645.1 hypothetical protein EF910_31035 [Streptomyces sp. WAC07149]GLX23627.1 hypothetical protein Slala01_72710 [Streptomyces lavendulae subsp. lavendulae]GLX31529.1 hypothetical protein Slala02_73480 [Streptomyces lavendulae subsp. lavendulae]